MHDGKIYLVAGIIDGHTSGTVAWFDEFDPETGVWTPLADAPRARERRARLERSERQHEEKPDKVVANMRLEPDDVVVLIAVDGGAIIDTSFPGFVALMTALGATIEQAAP